jgi:hypothetical protein
MLAVEGGAVAAATIKLCAALILIARDSVPRIATRAYRRPRISSARVAGPRFGGFVEADFSSQNPTAFGGLEECGPNSFVHAALQMLFFARPLRRRVGRHLCSHPACLACELRLVFDVLAQAPSLPHQHRTATNDSGNFCQHGSDGFLFGLGNSVKAA